MKITKQIFLTRTLARLSMVWMKSNVRQLLLNCRYRYWPTLLKRPVVIEVYLALNDPFSFVLVQVLPELKNRYQVDFKLLLISEAKPSDITDSKSWRQWAIKDANALAQQYHLLPLTAVPDNYSVMTGQQLWQMQRQTPETAIMLFRRTWNSEFKQHYPASTPVINTQIKNQTRLIAQGFYLPASLFFCGEWFWGIDRLEHLENKLAALSLTHRNQRPYFTKNRLQFLPDRATTANNNGHMIEAYPSLRSPYSYLGLMQVSQLAEHYQVPLVIKPVLPLMMRGFDLSVSKMRYIYLDVMREAKKLQLPFDDFVDPLGLGIVNCYQLFGFAQQQGLAVAFFKAIYAAVYVEGVDLNMVDNVKSVCQQIGLDYHAALAYEQAHSWQATVDDNLAELAGLGLWGVPCFSYQGIHVWGQDRLWQIEQAICQQNSVADHSV